MCNISISNIWNLREIRRQSHVGQGLENADPCESRLITSVKAACGVLGGTHKNSPPKHSSEPKHTQKLCLKPPLPPPRRREIWWPKVLALCSKQTPFPLSPFYYFASIHSERETESSIRWPRITERERVRRERVKDSEVKVGFGSTWCFRCFQTKGNSFW
jgi:hypothetical protein